MASVSKKDIPSEAKFFPLFWEMVKEFYIPEQSEDYWKAFYQRALEIDRECHSRLGQKLINAFADYIEEKQGNKAETFNKGGAE